MISGITDSSPDYRSQASSQSAAVAQNQVPSAGAQPAQPESSQPASDSIQLSASGLIALQTPEEVFRAATAGDNAAIAIIEEDLSPIPHTLDLTA